MRYPVILLATAVVAFSIGCSKSKSPAKGGGGGSTTGSFAFSNNEYQGSMTELSREWQKPILVHFNADSTVTDYCFFILSLNGQKIQQDSLLGKILEVGTGAGGGPSVTVYFKDIADTQIYNFSPDLSGLTGGSNGLASNQFYFSALTKNTQAAPSLSGSYWTSDTSKELNSTEGMPWYPDINGVDFGANGFSSYVRQGGPAEIGIAPNDTIVAFKYFQYGYRIYFYGYNENNGQGIPYFGIISNDGNTINADTYDFTVARVPNYDQTFDYYGEAGNPPVMHRHAN